MTTRCLIGHCLFHYPFPGGKMSHRQSTQTVRPASSMSELSPVRASHTSLHVFHKHFYQDVLKSPKLPKSLFNMKSSRTSKYYRAYDFLPEYYFRLEHSSRSSRQKLFFSKDKLGAFLECHISIKFFHSGNHLCTSDIPAGFHSFFMIEVAVMMFIVISCIALPTKITENEILCNTAEILSFGMLSNLFCA